MIDFSSSGSVYTRLVDDALKLFKTVANTSAMWSSEREVLKKALRVYEVDAISSLSAKTDSLFHKVENMSQTANVAQTRRLSCECGDDHTTVKCPILAQGMDLADFAQ